MNFLFCSKRKRKNLSCKLLMHSDDLKVYARDSKDKWQFLMAFLFLTIKTLKWKTTQHKLKRKHSNGSLNKKKLMTHHLASQYNINSFKHRTLLDAYIKWYLHACFSYGRFSSVYCVPTYLDTLKTILSAIWMQYAWNDFVDKRE